jgi:mannose-6-phosphate isomerase-like protein (cupin superfamily)
MKPTHKPYEKVEILELFEGLTMKVLLTGSDTNGLQAIFEDIVEPGIGPGRHIHHEQDETFLFLEGTFDVEIDGQLFRINKGDTAFVPRGSVHAWKNVGKTKGRLRYIFSPALNIEEMFRDLEKANKKGGITEEIMKDIALNYPEQESAGPPL